MDTSFVRCTQRCAPCQFCAAGGFINVGNKGNRRHQRLLKAIKPARIDIYVVKLNAHGEFTESRPCGDCIAAMRHVGVNRVFFSTASGTIECERVSNMSGSSTWNTTSTPGVTQRRIVNF